MLNQSVPVRIRLRYADLDSFVEKFAPNVTRGGLFLASRNVQPVGATVAFEIQLINGRVALAGEGKVMWVKPFDPLEPSRPYGMGVQFVSVEPHTRPVLARILRLRETSGRMGERRSTGAFMPLGAAAATAPANGKPAGAGPLRSILPPVDTSVDLAAEYGIDEATLKRVIDRIWMLGLRYDGGDLDALLGTEPSDPTATLAEAQADLPRLLDPQSSRRRMATGAFRPLEMTDDQGSGEKHRVQKE